MKKHSGLFAVLGVTLALTANDASAQFVPAKAGGGGGGGDDTGEVTFGGGSYDRRFYVSPMFSYTLADEDRATDDGLGGIISIGKRLTGGLHLELTGLYSQLDGETGANSAELYGVGVGAMVFPVRALKDLYGVLAVHYGQATDHPTTPATTGFNYRTTIFDTGVGYLIPLTDYLGGFDAKLRLEARYRMDAHTRRDAGTGGQKEFYEGVFNVGFLFPLGKLPHEIEAAEEEVEVVEAAPADADNDGVPDDVDQCPDTPAGAEVDPNGCEVVDDTDSDGDGVPDRLDQCPDTPAGAAVDENGCPVEAPQQEGCRQPAPGEPITLDGCATGDAIVLRGVSFDFNSSRLTANARVILNQVADALIAAADLQIEIGGHTDSIGSDAYNQNLSERRARSVHDYLVARGVPPSRMTVKGYGETQPVDTNETPEGREINRRVELRILGTGTP